MNTLIVGAGAVGGTIGAYMVRMGRQVTLVDSWWQHIETIRSSGLRVTSPEEDFRVEIPTLHIDELERLSDPVDLAIICPKAYDAEWAYRLVAPYLTPDGIVLFAQNGIPEEFVGRFADMDRVVGTVVNFAAECFELGHVRRTLTTGWPSLILGEIAGGQSARVEKLREHLAPVGEIRGSDSIMESLWSKLALNSMSNAAGAITSATTLVLWGDPDYADIAISAGSETAAVARAAGIAMKPVFDRIDPLTLERVYAGDMDARREATDLLAEIAEGRRGSHENLPSMLQDIMKGRRTEVDYIPGHVVRRGGPLGVPTPVNECLVHFVKEVENGRLVSGSDNLRLIKESLGA